MKMKISIPTIGIAVLSLVVDWCASQGPLIGWCQAHNVDINLECPERQACQIIKHALLPLLILTPLWNLKLNRVDNHTWKPSGTLDASMFWPREDCRSVGNGYLRGEHRGKTLGLLACPVSHAVCICWWVYPQWYRVTLCILMSASRYLPVQSFTKLACWMFDVNPILKVT